MWTMMAALAMPTQQGLEAPAPPPETPTLPDADRPSGPSARIINGEAASRSDWPMTGGMLLDAKVDLFGFEIATTALMCSSTLIAPDVVLLAAHCVDTDAMLDELGGGGITLSDRTFYWSRQEDLSGYQLGGPAGNLPSDAIAARDVAIHPDWVYSELGLGLTRNNDIALLFLDEPVLEVPPAVVPQPGEEEMQVGDEVVVVGWGQQVAVDAQEAPPEGSVGIKQLGTSSVAEIARFEFKVGEQQTDVRKCHGDSGGPSFLLGDSDSSEPYRLVGVTSHAYDASDCFLTGGVDTRVRAFVPWIDAEMRQRCRAGTRSWCEEWGLLDAPDASGAVAWEDREVETKGACSHGPTALWTAPWLLLPWLRRRRTLKSPA